MFERIANGWELTKQSAKVLRADKELLVFPLVSGLACLAVMASFLVPFVLNETFKQQVEKLVDDRSPLLWVAIFGFYFVNYFIIIYFNAAMVACAIVRFRGGDPTLATGFSAASSRLPQILSWAFVAATVGLLLNVLENQGKRHRGGGQFVISLLGMAWSVMTYFVVPVLVVEKLGPIQAIRRSTEIVRKTWGESLTSNFGIGVIVFLANLPAVLGFAGGILLLQQENPLGIVVLAVAIFWLLLVGLVSSALTAIARGGLYLYAADGEIPRGYDASAFRDAFVSN